MKRPWTLILVTLALPPVVASEPDTTGCKVFTAKAVEAEGFYIHSDREIWQESNGIEGLQRGASDCPGRGPIPADTCYTHTDNRQLQRCAFDRADDAAP